MVTRCTQVENGERPSKRGRPRTIAISASWVASSASASFPHMRRHSPWTRSMCAAQQGVEGVAVTGLGGGDQRWIVPLDDANEASGRRSRPGRGDVASGADHDLADLDPVLRAVPEVGDPQQDRARPWRRRGRGWCSPWMSVRAGDRLSPSRERGGVTVGDVHRHRPSLGGGGDGRPGRRSWGSRGRGPGRRPS